MYMYIISLIYKALSDIMWWTGLPTYLIKSRSPYNQNMKKKSRPALPHDFLIHGGNTMHVIFYQGGGGLQRFAVQFLIDTACTTNLLEKHVFDQLPQAVKVTQQKTTVEPRQMPRL